MPSFPIGRVSGALTRRPALIVLALLLVLESEVVLSLRHLSQTWDESVHIYSGYRVWQRDYGVNPEHPPLVKAVSALPLLALDLKEPPVATTGDTKPSNFAAGLQFLYGNDAEQILFRSRLAVSLFTLLLAALVFVCARDMCGLDVGLLALTLFVFEPNILAHGGLVTTDVAAACFLFGSVYTFYRYVKHPTVVRLLLCAGTVSLALIAKHSGVLIGIVLPILAASELLHRRNTIPTVWNTQRITSQLWRLSSALIVIAVIGIAGLWAAYGFRYSARPEHLPGLLPSIGALAQLLPDSRTATLVLALERTGIFPESYLWGLTNILQATSGRVSFLWGQIYPDGTWFYFPVAFAIKATIGLLALLLALPLVKALNPESRRELLFLAVPPLLYLGFAMTSGLNIGIRHLLPVFPFVVVLAAVGAKGVVTRYQHGTWMVTALVVFHAASSLHAYPNYLTYSNELAGGLGNTYRLLDDSNVDWGQQLKQVRRYVEEHDITECWFAYMVPQIDPKYYGIPCAMLPPVGIVTPSRPTPVIPAALNGTLFISAFQAAGKSWGPGPLNPYYEFFERKPDDLIGNSVLVFQGSFHVPLLSAISHASRGQQLLDDRPADALQEFHTAVSLAPESADLNARLCRALRHVNRSDEAEPFCETALSIASDIHPDYQFRHVASVRALRSSERGSSTSTDPNGKVACVDDHGLAARSCQDAMR
jgi:hypothetical protein